MTFLIFPLEKHDGLAFTNLISHFSSRACRAGVSIIRYCDDVHILHIWYHDAGRYNIFGARLGADVFVHIGAFSPVLSIHACDARIATVVVG